MNEMKNICKTNSIYGNRKKVVKIYENKNNKQKL